MSEDARLEAFTRPASEINGRKLRPFSAGSLTLCRKLGLRCVIDPAAAEQLSPEDRQKEATTLLWLQSQPLDQVLRGVQLAARDREAFEFEYLIPFEVGLDISALPQIVGELQADLAGITRSQFDVHPKPGSARSEAPPPPNS